MDVLKLPIVLASQSPRRKEIMEKGGFMPRIQPAHANEDFPADMIVYEVPAYLATKKAETLLKEIKDNEIILAADTVVIINKRIINKPENDNDAYRMLKLLSGQKHEVVTGVCLLGNNKKICFSDLTKVYFKELKDEEIWFYIRNYKPFDKAGSYGVQDFIGMVGIDGIEGCYFNVMGLPLRLVYHNLVKHFQLALK